MAQTIPVVLGPQRAGDKDTFSRRPPLIAVHLASDKSWKPSSLEWPIHNGRKYFALRDTGADSGAIDKEAASEIGAELKENGYVHGWMGPAQHVKSAIIQILLPSAKRTWENRFAVRDFRGAGQPWDVILGRDFLRHCHFFVDGPSGRYDLSWIA